MKPNSDEMHQAMEKAELMRESGEDPYSLSKSLIYMNKRINSLEKVFTAASQYVNYVGRADRGF